MRISDWSSDVCSSDLRLVIEVIGEPELRALARRQGLVAADQPPGQLLADPLQALQPGPVAGRRAAAGAARQMNLVTGVSTRLAAYTRHRGGPGWIGRCRARTGGGGRAGGVRFGRGRGAAGDR